MVRPPGGSVLALRVSVRRIFRFALVEVSLQVDERLEGRGEHGVLGLGELELAVQRRNRRLRHLEFFLLRLQLLDRRVAGLEIFFHLVLVPVVARLLERVVAPVEAVAHRRHRHAPANDRHERIGLLHLAFLEMARLLRRREHSHSSIAELRCAKFRFNKKPIVIYFRERNTQRSVFKNRALDELGLYIDFFCYQHILTNMRVWIAQLSPHGCKEGIGLFGTTIQSKHGHTISLFGLFVKS